MQAVSGTSEFSAPFETGISRVLLPLGMRHWGPAIHGTGLPAGSTSRLHRPASSPP
jgi:hypothetical protein